MPPDSSLEILSLRSLLIPTLASPIGILVMWRTLLTLVFLSSATSVKLPTITYPMCWLACGLLDYPTFGLTYFWLVVVACCLVTKSCMILGDPVDYSPPGSSVHGVSHTRILEWATTSFSRGSSWPRDWIFSLSLYRIIVLYTLNLHHIMCQLYLEKITQDFKNSRF